MMDCVLTWMAFEDAPMPLSTTNEPSAADDAMSLNELNGLNELNELNELNGLNEGRGACAVQVNFEKA